MTCDRCKECQDKGDKYCIYCGEMLIRPIPGPGCARCDECRANGDNFCKYCGKPLKSYREGCDRCEECLNNGDKFCRYCGKSLVKPENPLLTISFSDVSESVEEVKAKGTILAGEEMKTKYSLVFNKK